MTGKAKFLIADSVVPYRNLALEEYLLDSVEDGECILYLWQNFRTVVIGRNQNAFKECKTEKLEEDGGYLVRRLSGGGSVYQDMGNLNFTFLIKEADYNVDRQLSVIVKALEAFGLNGEKTGRNDLCVDGKKFSGNAFYKRNGHCYHHGTILVDADLQNMSRYLNVSAEKLKAHSVTSTRSRVVNLKELAPEMNIPDLKSALVKAFGEIYAEPAELRENVLDAGKVDGLTEKFASPRWRFGEHMKAGFKAEGRFPWGGIEILLSIRGDSIENAQVFTDALDDRLSVLISGCLKGARFKREEMAGRLSALARTGAAVVGFQSGFSERLPYEDGVDPALIADIIELLDVG